MKSLKGMGLLDFMELLKKQTDRNKIIWLLRTYKKANLGKEVESE